MRSAGEKREKEEKMYLKMQTMIYILTRAISYLEPSSATSGTWCADSPPWRTGPCPCTAAPGCSSRPAYADETCPTSPCETSDTPQRVPL